MAPTILVVGATGNTGRGVVRTLSELLDTNNTPFTGHRILALTRSSSGAESRKLAALPHVQVAEKNWVDITAAWLQQHGVVRAFIAPHDGARYVVDGPENITGRQLVAMVEREIGTTVGDVRFKDVSFVDHMAAQAEESKSLILSIKHALEPAWEGKSAASTTSPEVLRLAAPKVTPSEAFEAMIQG